MKRITSIFFCILMLRITACSQKGKKSEEWQLEYHFKVLDSIAKATPSSNILLNCPESVKFMQTKTGIEATTDGNYFGRFSCTTEDLRRWHEWYDKKNNKTKY
jgi:hypothetical protein